MALCLTRGRRWHGNGLGVGGGVGVGQQMGHVRLLRDEHADVLDR